jgi:hypothetical protein
VKLSCGLLLDIALLILKIASEKRFSLSPLTQLPTHLNLILSKWHSVQIQSEYKDDWLSSEMLRHVVRYKNADVSDVLAASIILLTALMMEVASTSETSENVYQTVIFVSDALSLLTHTFPLHFTIKVKSVVKMCVCVWGVMVYQIQN